MLKKTLSLSEVADFFRKHKSNAAEEVDELYDYLLAATAIASLIIAPNPVSAVAAIGATAGFSSIRVSRLLSWLPDKFRYGGQGRENFAIDRYEHAAVTHFMLTNFAIRRSFDEVYMPLIEMIQSLEGISENDLETFKKASEEADKKLQSTQLSVVSLTSKLDLEEYAIAIIEPLSRFISWQQSDNENSVGKFKEVDISALQATFLNRLYLTYNGYLLSFAGEFPEFALWIDLTSKKDILGEISKSRIALTLAQKELEQNHRKSLELIIAKIESLRNQKFQATAGFPTFISSYEKLFKRHEEHLFSSLQDSLSSKVRENIEAHHARINAELDKLLVDNEDVDDVVYPRVRDIYISQSFQHFVYKKKVHKRAFLTKEFWNEHAASGQNIGNELLETIADPIYCHFPIVILGNPGAGKSMLSKMFAGQLSMTNDYIPFLIKLRNVGSGTSNISEHIAKGLAKSIENLNDINWLDWAKEFRDRIPVIILDGFDELMRVSQSDLNNYLNAIREFQETALLHRICVRVILTSRVTVMQEVNIPDRTKVIRLCGFDKARKNLWTEVWNNHQQKSGYKFKLPKSDEVQSLAEEPLLLFMLAMYDFQRGGLQLMASEDNFSQSKLYDSLLHDFAIRQLNKNELYINADSSQREVELEEFRLRLGVIALLMFLKDTTHLDIQHIKNDIAAFGLDKSVIHKENILGGFFFIHENKSTTEGEVENLNYEFLHKTFGEFLAADFLLRVTLKQKNGRGRNYLHKEETFKFCFGYNWLHKHSNILNFLMEHAPNLISEQKDVDEIINEKILVDLALVFSKPSKLFPITDYNILEVMDVVDHLAIYSQNLILLWCALSYGERQFRFEVYELHHELLDKDSQDGVASFSEIEKSGNIFLHPHSNRLIEKVEKNKNKLLWKKLSALWNLSAGRYASAKLGERISIREDNTGLSILNGGFELIHNYANASLLSGNDYELILSLFDRDNFIGIELPDCLMLFDKMIQSNPEYEPIIIDVCLNQRGRAINVDTSSILEWLVDKNLRGSQFIMMIEFLLDSKHVVEPLRKYEMFLKFLDSSNYHLILQEILHDLENNPLVMELDGIVDIVSRILHFESVNHFDFGRFNPEGLLALLKLENHFIRTFSTNKMPSRFVEELVHNLTRDPDMYHGFSFSTSIVYLDIIKELNSELRRDSLHLPSRQVINLFDFFLDNSSRVSPEVLVEYLYAFSKMKINLSGQEHLTERLSQRLDGLFREISPENIGGPNYMLKLLAVVNRFSFHKGFQPHWPDGMLVQSLLGKIKVKRNLYNGKSPGFLLDYLKLIKEVGKYPIGLRSHVTNELMMDVAHHYNDLMGVMQSNPDFSIEFIQLFRSIVKLFKLSKKLFSDFYADVFYQHCKGVKSVLLTRPKIATAYVNFLFKYFNRNDQGHQERLMDLVGELHSIKLPISQVRIIAVTMIKYEIDGNMIMPFLHKLPALRAIYLDERKGGRYLSEIINEIQYENFG